MADANEKLISLIKARRPIYDSTHRDHSNRLVVDGLWMEIATEMNKTASEVKSKWTKLRNAYVRELREKKLNNGDAGKKKKKSWYLSDSLRFLQGSIRHRKLMEHWSDSYEHLSNFSFPVENYSTNCLVKVEEQNTSVDGYSNEDSNSGQEETTDNMEKKKTAKQLDENPVIINSKNYVNELNSDLLFFKSLLPDILKLSNSNKRKFKLSLLGSLNELLEAQEKQNGSRIEDSAQNKIESSASLLASTSSQLGMSLTDTQDEICNCSTSVTSSQYLILKMIQRPKVGETEEDLLKQEEEFLNSSGRRTSFKRKMEVTERKPSPKFEILTNIKERNVGDFNLNAPKSEDSKGFPKLFVIDSSLVQKKKTKKSLFALQLEKNKKVLDDKMDCEEEELESPSSSENAEIPQCSDIKKAVHEENLNKLSKLTENEILEQQKKLLSTLDPKLVEFLKVRGKTKEILGKKEEKMEEPQEEHELDEEEVKRNLEKCIDSKWINMDFLEKEKLEWIGDIPDKKSLEPEQPYSARFDFKGELQPFSKEIDVRSSLYHHGDEPNRPGYTIQELYQLSRSQVLQQRIIALTTLANIIRKTKLGYYDRCFDGQLLHKLIESDLFFLLRFSIDDNSLISSSLYCLHNLLCSESDEFCLDKLMGVTLIDEQPLLFNKIEASKDEEGELKDHVIISCDMVKGVIRTDLLVRLMYVLNNFSPNRETIVRGINCLIRISRHSTEAAIKILQTPNLLEFVFDNIRTSSPIYECVKLLRILSAHSAEATAEIVQKCDLRFMISFVEAEENQNISKKEFFLLKLETLYFWRSLLLRGLFVNEFVMWSPCLLRLLLFYTQKVDINANNDFDFELFSAMTSLIIVCNQKKLSPDPSTPVMMRICLEKWLKQLIQHDQYNYAISKALGCAFRYFTSHFKAFGVTSLDLDFIKKINIILVSLFESKAFNNMSFALIQQSHLLHPTKVTRDPDNLPSLCSVYDGGEEFLKIVQNSSALPFFISLVKYLKTAHRVFHESLKVIKLFAESPNVRKYVWKVCECDEKIYSWFMKFETAFLTDFLKLLVLLEDEETLLLSFRLLPLLRVDDKNSNRVLKIIVDKNNWKVKEEFFDSLSALYSGLLFEDKEKVEVLNYKNSLVPEDWCYRVFSLLRGKEAVETVTNILKFIALILARDQRLIKKVSYTYRFYNLCHVFLTDSNVFDVGIQNILEVIFEDVLANQEKVNLNLKYEKKKSFYDLYTELITQYAGVSYGLPIFAKLVLFPLQNRFNVSYRKLLWFEYLHVLRVVTLPFPATRFVGLEGFVEPCETDESLLVAYINSVANDVIMKSRNPFVYNIAIGNIKSFLKSTDQDEKLLTFLKKKIECLKNAELKADIMSVVV